MRKQAGFTVLELIVAISITLIAGTVFVVQKNNLSAGHRDSQRKIAINAIYYNLEEVVYPTLKGYPAQLSAEQLKAMDSALLKDPRGVSIGDASSDYSYEPSSCNGNICKHYVLRAVLEREAAFERKSRN